MEYITIPEFALLHSISVHKIRELCESKSIEGAVRFGKIWALPNTAVPAYGKKRRRSTTAQSAVQSA